MARFWMRRRLRIIFISHWYTVSYLIFLGFGILFVGGKVLGVSDPVREKDWDGRP